MRYLGPMSPFVLVNHVWVMVLEHGLSLYKRFPKIHGLLQMYERCYLLYLARHLSYLKRYASAKCTFLH